MNVRQYQIANEQETHDHIYDDDEHKNQFSTKLEVIDDLKELIIDAMLCNTDTRMEATDQILEKIPGEKKGFFHFPNDKVIEEQVYEPRGSPVEEGVIRFLLDNDIDV